MKKFRQSRLDSVYEYSESLESQPGANSRARPPPSPMRPTTLKHISQQLVSDNELSTSSYLAAPTSSPEKKTSVYCMDGGLLLPPRRLTEGGDRAVSIASTTCIQAHLAAGEPIFIDVDRGTGGECKELSDAVRLDNAARKAIAEIEAEQIRRFSVAVKTQPSYNIAEKPLPYSPTASTFSSASHKWSRDNIVATLKTRRFYTRFLTLFLPLDVLARIVTLLIFILAGLSFFFGIEQLLTIPPSPSLKTLLIPLSMTIFSFFILTVTLQALSLMYGPSTQRRSVPAATALICTTTLSAAVITMGAFLWFFYAARSRRSRDSQCARFSTFTSRERERLAVMNGPFFETCLRRSATTERVKLFWGGVCIVGIWCCAVLGTWAVDYRRRICFNVLLEEAGEWDGVGEKLGLVMEEDEAVYGTVKGTIGVDSPQLGKRNGSIARYPSIAMSGSGPEVGVDEREYVYHDDRSVLERERDEKRANGTNLAQSVSDVSSFYPQHSLASNLSSLDKLDTSLRQDPSRPPPGRQLVSPVGSVRSIHSNSSCGGSFASASTAGRTRGQGSMTVEIDGYRVEVSGGREEERVQRRVVFEFPPEPRRE